MPSSGFLKTLYVGVGVSTSLSRLAPPLASLVESVALNAVAVGIAFAAEETDKHREDKREHYWFHGCLR